MHTALRSFVLALGAFILSSSLAIAQAPPPPSSGAPNAPASAPTAKKGKKAGKKKSGKKKSGKKTGAGEPNTGGK